jgi:glycosyltransferase involved in cell wall biosynthesis
MKKTMQGRAESVDMAILTNFVPPARLPVFQYISRRLRTIIFVDTEMENNRKWTLQNDKLHIHVVRSLSVPVTYTHPQGFREKSYLHLPYGLFFCLLAARPKRILSGELGMRTAIACLYKILRPSVRLIVWTEGTAHTDAPRGILRKWWRKVLVKIPDNFIAVSSGAKELMESYGVPERRLRMSLFVSGFDPPLHIPARDMIQQRRLLYCGRLNELKGVRGFVDALVSVQSSLNRPVELWFVGYGSDEKYLRDLPLPHNLSFRFLGYVPFERITEIYCQCGILVFPTLSDVWGLVTNEAMMYGMPVLGSRYAQSVCDLVTDGKTGWTFVPDNRAEMEHAIHAALSASEEELHAMGKAAHQRVENCTPEVFAEDVLNAFKAIDRVQHP